MESLRTLTESTLSSALDTFSGILNSPDWENIGNKHGTSGFELRGNSNLNTIKGIGMIPFSPEQVLEFILNPDYSWDKTLEESRVVHDFAEDLKIVYERYKCPWPVSNRDFVYGMKVLLRDEGVYLLAKSLEAGVEENKGTVRGEIIISGYFLKRIDGQTECTYIVSIDPKGSIPKLVARKLNKEQIGNINSIREFMLNLYKPQ